MPLLRIKVNTTANPTNLQVRDRTWMVALAASLWGTDALFRVGLVAQLPSATIVFTEHLILVLVTLPWISGALRRAARACRPSDWIALVVIGAGASATATILFTMAFRYGDPITPVALQKVQPLFAAGLAAFFLGERLRPRYAIFVGSALLGAWLLAFKHPLAVSTHSLEAALLALGAAALWAAGTVAGRRVVPILGARDTTVLRFAIGLPASAIAAISVGSTLMPPVSTLPRLCALALIPGLLALTLYYQALRTTPASRATLAELAFPATAALVGVVVLGASPSGTQWLGLGLLAFTVLGFARHELRSRRTAVIDTHPVRQLASQDQLQPAAG
jgi:DME family drug/metabolite transporter